MDPLAGMCWSTDQTQQWRSEGQPRLLWPRHGQQHVRARHPPTNVGNMESSIERGREGTLCARKPTLPCMCCRSIFHARENRRPPLHARSEVQERQNWLWLVEWRTCRELSAVPLEDSAVLSISRRWPCADSLRTPNTEPVWRSPISTGFPQPEAGCYPHLCPKSELCEWSFGRHRYSPGRTIVTCRIPTPAPWRLLLYAPIRRYPVHRSRSGR